MADTFEGIAVLKKVQEIQEERLKALETIIIGNTKELNQLRNDMSLGMEKVRTDMVLAIERGHAENTKTRWFILIGLIFTGSAQYLPYLPKLVAMLKVMG